MKITRENLTMISTILRVQNKDDFDKIFDENLQKIENLSEEAAKAEENLDFILDGNVEKIEEYSETASDSQEFIQSTSSDEVKNYSEQEECRIEKTIKGLFEKFKDQSLYLKLRFFFFNFSYIEHV